MLWWFWWLLGPLVVLYRSRVKGEILWYDDCKRCGYNVGGKMYQKPWFRVVASGEFHPREEPSYSWWEGWQSCPRCRNKWYVSESTG